MSVQQNMAVHHGVTELLELADLADGYVATARNKVSSCAIEQKSVFPSASLTPPVNVSESVESPLSCAAVRGRRPSGKKLCWRHAKFGKKAHGCADVSGCDWKRRQGNGHAGCRETPLLAHLRWHLSRLPFFVFTILTLV